MIQNLFMHLSHAVEGSPAIALTAAFIWGVLSILLSPCHLASIPLIVGFIDDQGRLSLRRAFLIAFLFAVGILLSIAAIGVATALAGRMLGDIGGYGNFFVAGIFFLVGLYLLDVIALPWGGLGQAGLRRKGPLAAFLLGLIFGIALGPCTFAYMAPMLALSFRLAASNSAYGILLLLMYGAGHCSVIVFAGGCTGLVQRYLQWTTESATPLWIKRFCGLLVILAGLWLLYSAPS